MAYTPQTTPSSYNQSPPADDGSQTAANRVSWATIKTKLADPLNTFITAVVTSLDKLTAAGDILYLNGTAYTRLAIGTAGQALKVNAGATAPEWASPHIDSIATSSGTTADITDIPVCNRIRIGLAGISQDTANTVLILQLGDADGGFEDFSYVGSLVQPSSTSGNVAFSTGFSLTENTLFDAATEFIGEVVLTHYGSNRWWISSSGNITGQDAAFLGSGFKVLSGVLTQIRLTTVAGTATFDAGTMYLVAD